MRYSEFINFTILNKNEINLNYYSADINTQDLLRANRSKDYRNVHQLSNIINYVKK